MVSALSIGAGAEGEEFLKQAINLEGGSGTETAALGASAGVQLLGEDDAAGGASDHAPTAPTSSPVMQPATAPPTAAESPNAADGSAQESSARKRRRTAR